MICPACSLTTKPTEHEGYHVCADGHFISLKPWRGRSDARVIAPVSRPDRYDFVRARINGARVTLDLHPIVARAFLGPAPSHQHEVRHLDGDKHNNSAANLAWGTHKENSADQVAHGTSPVGSRNPGSKLSERDVAEIKRRLEAGESPTVLAPLFGCSRETIYDIRHGRKWKHV